MSDRLPYRCEPDAQFRDLPYHWVQWKTLYRCDEPQPWTWHTQARFWTTSGGSTFSPERAAALQWHYLEPAYPPTLLDQRQISEQLARVLTAQHFALRYNKPPDDALVKAAVETQWKIIGLPQVPIMLNTLHGLNIRW
jgi:hypothetical protein